MFEPLPAGSGNAGGSSASGGAGGTAVAGAGGSPSTGAAGSSPSEGQGGSLSLAGAGGTSGSGSSGAGPVGGVVADAGTPDAGESEEAGAPPIECEGAGPEVCDGRDNDCDGVIDPAPACPDECAGFALEDRAYIFCTEAVDRGIALALCGAEDMKLAWLESPEENAAVVASIEGLGLAGGGDELVVQMGASDSDDEDEWFWIGNAAALDGFQFWEGNAAEDDDADDVDGAYENWASGEPNDLDGEDCGVFSVTGNEFREPGEWDDHACGEELPFLCEQP